MKKIFIPIFICLCLIAYVVGYSTTTTTTNLLLVKPASEDTTVDWFDTMNDNMDLIDANSPKVKLDATSAPGVTNDTDEGYIAGSIWVDVTNDKAYVCLDNTDGAAVWTETTGAGGGATTFLGLTDTPANYTGQSGKYTKVNAGETALEFGTPAGGVDTSGTPEANDIARFTDVDTIEGINYTELKTALALSSDDLSDVASIAMLDENETVTAFWVFEGDPAFKHTSDFAESSANFAFRRLRTTEPNIVQSGDSLGFFQFTGYSGVTFRLAAKIEALVDGTPGSSDMPGRLEFSTSPDGTYSPVLRMAIDNAGNIKMGDGAWTNYANVDAGGVLTFGGTASINEPMSVFAATTSAELAGVISDETGTLKLVYSDSPVFTTQITTPIIDLTGGQIAFPAEQAASANANTLDDYEEGTWTAVIRGQETAGTYEIASQHSNYTKIGRVVHLESKIVLASSITGGGAGYLQITGCPFTKMANSAARGSISTVGVDFTGSYLSVSFISDTPVAILYIPETVDNGAAIPLPITAVAASDEIVFSITFFI